MAVKIFRINYKSDFILTLASDAGWETPFCIKFWTDSPQRAFYAQYDGETYTHCAPVEGEPTKLMVQMDDHHMGVGDLKFQIAYHFTVADFPTSVEDEVINQASVIIEVDDAPAQVMLDFNGETAPEIEFSLPAYTNEQQRIANEEARIAAEQQRIANEESRIAAETIRQQNEQQRIDQETARVNEFARLKQESETATADANAAATLANEKAQLAADKAALAQAAATLANEKAQLAADKAALAQAAATLANEKAALAQQKAEYAQTQGDYAKEQGAIAEEDHARAEQDHERAESDHAALENVPDSAPSTSPTDLSGNVEDVYLKNRSTNNPQAPRTLARLVTDSAKNRPLNESLTRLAEYQSLGFPAFSTSVDYAEGDPCFHDRRLYKAKAGGHSAGTWNAAHFEEFSVKEYTDAHVGIFDVSANNGGAVFASLQALLSDANLNTLIPAPFRRGGITITFIQGTAQSSDNKYVQYRYMEADATTTATFTNVANWQGVDDEPTVGSENLVKSGGVQKFIQTEVGLNFEQTYPIPETSSIYALPFNLKSGETIHIYCAVLSRYTTKLRNNSTELIRMGSVGWYVYTATDDFNNLNLEIDSRNDHGDLHFLMVSGAFWDIINKVAKIDNPIEGNFPVISSTGEIANSNYNPNSFQPKDTTILKQADIVNNLNSDDNTKVLSASQGKILHEIEKEIMIDNSKEIAAITTNYMWNRGNSSTDDPNPTDYDAKPRIGNNITFALANNTVFPYIGNVAQFTFGATGNVYVYQLIELDGSADLSNRYFKIGFEVEVSGSITDARVYLGNDSSKINTGINIQNSSTKWQSSFNGSNIVARNGKYYIWLRLWATENSVVRIGRFTVVEIQTGENISLPYPALRLDTQYKEELKNFFVDANAVKFVEQVLTDGQKQQARENIGITRNVADTSPYTGKKFYSIGDSITYQNLWQPTLADLMMMNYQSAATRDADYPLGIGGAAICPVITLRTTSQGDAYKAVDNLGNQLVDGNNNPLWFEVGKAPKQSIYYRADYFDTEYDDAEVIVMHAGQNDSNRSEAGDERRTFLEIGTVSDTPYTGLQYVLPQFAQVALYYPNVAIYDPDGTIAQDPTYSGCTFITERPTFCACLAGVIKKICSACPEARFVIDSIMRYKVNPGVEDDPIRIAVYNAMKSVCQIYDIPFVDLWNEMGYNYYNFEVYHKPNDGIHPNETGGRRMAAVIAQKL